MLQQTEVQPRQKAVMIIHQMSDDEKIQELARIREKALHDEVSALSTARREGREEGEAMIRCYRNNCSVLRKLDMLQQTDVQPIQKAVKIIHRMTIVLQL